MRLLFLLGGHSQHMTQTLHNSLVSIGFIFKPYLKPFYFLADL